MNNKKDYLKALLTSRIYFAHMSVGDNIIQGVSEIFNTDDYKNLNILKKHEKHINRKNFIMHSHIGNNTDPVQKCHAFKSIIESEIGDYIDIALLKFCYIDINNNTNISQLFNEYKAVMNELILKFPDITFIHVTTPLRHIDSGFSIWFRELIGRPNISKLSNIKRNQFNKLLHSYYKSQPIFDLAAAESTHPDGTRETFKYKNSETYYGLIAEYTNDNGHLNDKGRKIVADAFIKQLAIIINNKNAKN
ncbi:MAG: hypothetical protein OQK98_05975 [Gammaproteobacteria bacterium]|nr:hypothetical protein [Gammaproteobacteria bacterium]